MKRFVLAFALICSISSATLAGDIPSTGQPEPQASSPVVTAILTIISVVV